MNRQPLSAACVRNQVGRISNPSTTDWKSVLQRRVRRALTLVELLVTITIIAILAATALLAMAAASDSAKAAKTRAMVVKLHGLVMERWDSYRARRVPFVFSTQGMLPGQVTQAQLQGLRELMLMELPDRWSEVTDQRRFSGNFQRTALSQAYKHAYDAILAENRRRPRNGGKPPTPQHQGAECLYMIITMATGDGEALELFSENDIGDADGDGAPEFLDGWGKPISFLRWPAGFVSELQPDFINGDRIPDHDPGRNHDPFDPYLRDSNAYALVPRIYSSGSDQDFDIVADNQSRDFRYPSDFDPYVPVDGVNFMGTQRDVDNDFVEEWQDNIHNHLIGQR
jgi:prepilin-type N-terminal cleavage/methylation domain-containing protein